MVEGRGERVAKVVVGFVSVAFLVVWVVMLLSDSDNQARPATARTVTSDRVLSAEDCESQADGLLRDNPSVYASRQEAVDGCVAAGRAVGELEDR